MIFGSSRKLNTARTARVDIRKEKIADRLYLGFPVMRDLDLYGLAVDVIYYDIVKGQILNQGRLSAHIGGPELFGVEKKVWKGDINADRRIGHNNI